MWLKINQTKPTMTKITNEILEDYAMPYPRIECVKVKNRGNELIRPLGYIRYCILEEIEYIQLRSIESINDEELDKACELLGCETKRNWLISAFYGDWSHKTTNCLAFYQYLQSIGIATPTIDKEFNTITVDELVESGKLKLV